MPLATHPGGNLLGQRADPQLGHALDDAVVDLELAGDDPEQRGFAAAITADQTNPLAALDLKFDSIQ